MGGKGIVIEGESSNAVVKEGGVVWVAYTRRRGEVLYGGSVIVVQVPLRLETEDSRLKIKHSGRQVTREIHSLHHIRQLR